VCSSLGIGSFFKLVLRLGFRCVSEDTLHHRNLSRSKTWVGRLGRRGATVLRDIHVKNLVGNPRGEPMRILMASDFYYPFLPGGGERRMYEIARGWPKSTKSTCLHGGSKDYRITSGMKACTFTGFLSLPEGSAIVHVKNRVEVRKRQSPAGSGYSGG